MVCHVVLNSAVVLFDKNTAKPGPGIRFDDLSTEAWCLIGRQHEVDMTQMCLAINTA